MCGSRDDDPSMHDVAELPLPYPPRADSFDGTQYRNHMVGCTVDYDHPGRCVSDTGCYTFSDPEDCGICVTCGREFMPNHTEQSFGPVLNADGTPTAFTQNMLADTGRHAGWVVLDDQGIHLEIS